MSPSTLTFAAYMICLVTFGYWLARTIRSLALRPASPVGPSSQPNALLENLPQLLTPIMVFLLSHYQWGLVIGVSLLMIGSVYSFFKLKGRRGLGLSVTCSVLSIACLMFAYSRF